MGNHHGPSSQVRRHGQAARRPAGLVAPIVHPHRHAHVRDLPGLRLPLLRQTVQDAAVGRLPPRQGEPPVGVELDFHLPPAGAAVVSLVHEAGLAVLQIAPDKFWDFSQKLFDDQEAYFDVNIVNETRNATYRRLADLAGTVGIDKDKFYKMLVIPDKPGEDGALNIGNQVTNDMKVVTKMNRLIGVHVTPTVVFDGVVQDTSSSWGKDEWDAWLKKNVV